MRLACPLLALGLAVGALSPAPVSAQATGTLRDQYDFDEPATDFDLPGRLVEVSGLALSPDGRLFAHDDERAVVYEIHPSREEVGKRFSLGDPPVRGDFEGIAVVGERFFLITSRGSLHEFREMPDGAEAPYRVTDTGLGARCEIEGLDHDPSDDVLLVACKVSVPERGTLVIHRLPMLARGGELAPLLVDRNQLAAHGVDPAFRPSAVAVAPGGTIVLLSATVGALVEVDRSGVVISGVRLPSSRHRQPEGLAFSLDGTLYIADEGDGREARVTGYTLVERKR